MKRFEIWCEGFAATGESGDACKVGEVEAESFSEACQKYADANPGWAKLFNAERLTYWGCSLFSNEQEARVAFG